MHAVGEMRPTGELGLRVIRQGVPWPTEGPMSLAEIRHHGLPRRGLGREVNAWRARNTPNLWRGARRVLAARALNLSNFYGSLFITVIRADGDRIDADVVLGTLLRALGPVWPGRLSLDALLRKRLLEKTWK